MTSRTVIWVAAAAVVVLGALLGASLWWQTRSSAPVVSAPAAPPADSTEAVAAPPGSAQTPPESASAPDPEAPTFDVVRVSPRGEVVMAGRAPSGHTVAVRRGREVLTTVTADPTGQWAVVFTEPLSPGVHELDLTTADSGDGLAGGTVSRRVVVVDVPEAPGAEGTAVAVAVPRSEAAARAAVLQGPPPAEPALVTPPAAVVDTADPAATETETPVPVAPVAVETAVYDRSGRTDLSGTAPRGSRLRVYVNNAFQGLATAGPEGTWSLTFTPEPDRPAPDRPGTGAPDSAPPAPRSPAAARDQPLDVRVDQVDAGGTVVGRVAVPLHRPPLTTLPEGQRMAVVERGSTLWRLARETYGTGEQYVDIYRANRDQIRDPNLIYPGQVITLPAAE